MPSSRWLSFFSYIIMQQSRKGEPGRWASAEPGPFSPCVTRCHHRDPRWFTSYGPRVGIRKREPHRCDFIHKIYGRHIVMPSPQRHNYGYLWSTWNLTKEAAELCLLFPFSAGLIHPPPPRHSEHSENCALGGGFCDRNITDATAHFLSCNL